MRSIGTPLALAAASSCAALGAFAQSGAPAPVPPNPAMLSVGMDKNRMESTDLNPHAPRLTVTPLADLPLASIKVPKGFKVEVWAHGMPGARMMTRGDKGTIFVGTRVIGRVYAVTDSGGQRNSKVIAEKMIQPNGLAFRNGSLYVAAINRVLRYDEIESKLDAVPDPVDLSEAFKLPQDLHHAWKFLSIGPDNKLYVPVGIPCNACEINPSTHGNIRRYNLDGSGMEIVARGVRNSVGFDFHPETGELWFTDNGRDWHGENGPQDELNRVPAKMVGASFGNPYCHANGIPDQDIVRPNACAGTVPPVALMGPHAAALGMRFYTGGMFPKEYQGAIFVARHGSWNKTKKAGFDVVSVHAAADGKRAKVRPFLTGLLDDKNNGFLGRPTDVLVMPDGALLVSDEQNGAIYRISHD